MRPGIRNFSEIFLSKSSYSDTGGESFDSLYARLDIIDLYKLDSWQDIVDFFHLAHSILEGN